MKILDKLTDTISIQLLSLITIFLLSWASFFNIGNGFYGDPFHQGEYLAALQLKLQGMSFYSIHGAMDWLPGLVSIKLFGLKHYFLFIKIIYASLSLFSCFLLWIVTSLFIKNKQKNINFFVLAVLPFLSVHMVSYKDSFLLLSFFIFLLLESHYKDYKSLLMSNLLEVLLGFFLALNFIWSFERGLAGLFSIGIASMYYLFFKRQRLITFFSFFLTLILFAYYQFFSFNDYLLNLFFLFDTSAQWSYGYKKITPIFYTLLGVIPNIYAAYHLLKRLVTNRKASDCPLLLTMLVLMVFMAKVGLNRADFGHILMALWMPAIIFIYLHNFHHFLIPKNVSLILITSLCLLSLKNPHNYWLLLLPILLIIQMRYTRALKKWENKKINIIFLIFLLIFCILKLVYDNHAHKYDWIAFTRSPPANENLVNPGVNWINSIFIERNISCVFDMSNNGVINGILNLPSCTKYSYLVYAAKNYEANIIEDLKIKRPEVIIYSTKFWSYAIDGKPMYSRFIELNKYILNAYPYEECKFDYCLRYLSKN